MGVSGFDRGLFAAIAKALVLAMGLLLVWVFLSRIVEVLLVFAMATIAAIALAPAVNWLERKRVGRGYGTVLVLMILFAIAAGLNAIIAPILRPEINHLAHNFPQYGQQVLARLKELAAGYPSLENALNDPNLLNRFSPVAEQFLGRVGHFSLSLVTVAVGALVTLTLTAYILAVPRPLLRGIMQLVPADHRDSFQHALIRGSDMIVKWVWANAIIGLFDAVVASIALGLMGVPGAFVWGAVTMFSEMVPQLGAYLMAIPPTIVALATDPPKALWVIVFYICLQQVVNHLLAPLIRAKTMRIHPVSEIFTVLSLTLVFGILGAVIADPVLGFVKAFYDSFYGEKQDDPDLDARAEKVLQRTRP
jgi:predicted PurR-regulated permease PerM